MIRVVIQKDDFDVREETRRLIEHSTAIGGVNTFLGVVRNNNENEDVSSLFLEHYPGMTEKQIVVSNVL